MPKKSIYRQPGAQHFQLVHRSQRDPLIHDPESSKHVLKGFERENVRKGKTRAELEESIPEISSSSTRSNTGEASLYDIYYDDTEYDYMQHLREVGTQDSAGADVILLEAPKKSNKGKGKAPIFLKDDKPVIPDEALPSKQELERSYESQMAIPSALAGFQPNMDLHLRQVLEALEDDAFVDDELDDDFFGELVEEGERDANEDVEFEFAEEGLSDEDAELDEEASKTPTAANLDDSFEARFSRFKREQKQQHDATGSDDESGGDDVYDQSEGGDTLGSLPELPNVRSKRRRKAASDATGYSLSSSSMFRNAGLTTLDEQFARLEKEYASDDDDDDEDDDDGDDDIPFDEDLLDSLSITDSEAPELRPVRADFDNLMDDFLDKYELVGGKMRPVLEGATPAEKLNTLRNAMVADGLSREDIKRKYGREAPEEEDNDENIPMPAIVGMGKGGDRWDVETILSTYTNLENHPRLIDAFERVPRIRLDKRTGLPSVDGTTAAAKSLRYQAADDSRKDLREEVFGSDAQRESRETITRAKDETPEEKKARKAAVKQEKQHRRTEKKTMRETFSAERKHQQRVQGGKQVQASVRKL